MCGIGLLRSRVCIFSDYESRRTDLQASKHFPLKMADLKNSPVSCFPLLHSRRLAVLDDLSGE